MANTLLAEPSHIPFFKKLQIYFKLCVPVCVFVWVCLHECRCLKKTEVLEVPRVEVIDGCEPPKVGNGN